MQALFEVSSATLLAVPIVVGFVQLIKHLGLPSKFAPLASVVVGLGLMAVAGGTWQEIVMSGIIVGLTASGLYSAKSVAE